MVEVKKWRTLIRYIDQHGKYVVFNIPAWNSSISVSLHQSQLPLFVLEYIRDGAIYFHGLANISAPDENPDALAIEWLDEYNDRPEQQKATLEKIGYYERKKEREGLEE